MLAQEEMLVAFNAWLSRLDHIKIDRSQSDPAY